MENVLGGNPGPGMTRFKTFVAPAMASLLRTPAFLVTGLKNFTRAGYVRAIAEVPATATAMGDLDALKGTVYVRRTGAPPTLCWP